MTSFEIDLDDSLVRESLDDLKDEYESGPVYMVISGAEYSVHIEFGRGPITAGDNIRGLGLGGPQVPGGISGDEPQALRFENENGEIIYRASVSGHPPYPFFEPAIREYKSNPNSFLLSNTGLNSLDEIDSTEDLVRTVALALERQMKTNATAQAAGRSPGTHPNHPQVDTGNLRASIRAKRIK